jgi:hypothetical protein
MHDGPLFFLYTSVKDGSSNYKLGTHFVLSNKNEVLFLGKGLPLAFASQSRIDSRRYGDRVTMPCCSATGSPVRLAEGLARYLPKTRCEKAKKGSNDVQLDWDVDSEGCGHASGG